jgi:nicotinamidase-related amidase
MSDVHYNASRTGLLLVDPYNDFLSDGGKLWPMVKDVAGEVGLLDNLRSIVAAARAADIRVFFVPHRRWGSRAMAMTGFIRIQASAQCKSGRP